MLGMPTQGNVKTCMTKNHMPRRGLERHCISDTVWCILQEPKIHSDAMQELPEVDRRKINRIVFELVYRNCLHNGPMFILEEGTENSPTSAYFLRYVKLGYFHGTHGGWGPIQNFLPLNITNGMHFLMTGSLPIKALQHLASIVWKESAFQQRDGSIGQFPGELLSRDLTWHEERLFFLGQKVACEDIQDLEAFE